jgi:hypothetical protein
VEEHREKGRESYWNGDSNGREERSHSKNGELHLDFGGVNDIGYCSIAIYGPRDLFISFLLCFPCDRPSSGCLANFALLGR